MSLQTRLALVSVASVGATAAALGLAAPYGAAALGLGLVAAVVLSAALGQLVVVGPLVRELARSADRVRGRGAEAPRGWSEFAGLESALQARTVDVDARIDAVQREVQTVLEVLETSPLGVASVDEEGRILRVNQTFRGMFRLRGEPEGRRPIEVVPVVEIHEVVEAALAGRECEKSFVTASLDLVARAHPLAGGRAVVRVEDETGRREAERARTDFVANVSHELRTPLTAILGYLETLMTEVDRLPDDLYVLLETVDRNARRLRDLFEDLLRLHRIEARRRELPLERHALRPLLESSLAFVREKAHKRQQQFTLECPDDLVGVVNPEAFSAIVSNLASNASSYTGEGGHVRVRAGKGPDGAVRIDVIDDGIGIAERHHERIFERFYRVDEARSRRVGGTGLGLAIVKHYALASRCNVTLLSKEGSGSTFTVHLPDA